MHNVLWRVDVDLNGSSRDGVDLMRHQEPSGTPQRASDIRSPFNGGVEGGVVWNPQEFTMLHVRDNATLNAAGDTIGYDLMPVRFGSARHAETFTQNDFWVTRYRGTELFYTQLPTYANGEAINDADIVVWASAPVHHQVRDEDGEFVGNLWNGVALVMWGGFDLRPRNLFAGTPLHP